MHISNYMPAHPTVDPWNPTPEHHQRVSKPCNPSPETPSHSNPTTQPQPPATPTQHTTQAPLKKPPPDTNRIRHTAAPKPPPESHTHQPEHADTHHPVNLTETQSEYPPFTGLMCPHPETSNHLAFNLLSQYATTGCPADCGPPWTQAHLEAAIRRGAHPSARTPDAAAALRAEALEKVEQGFARLVTWDSIKDKPPTNLKISPLAAVPHKSRRYRAILDLSFQIRMGGLKLPSVNANTKPHAHRAAMRQLGQVLPRLIWAMATAAPEHGPLFFAKWDIKDGFWRLVVSPDDAWHFCYVLPPTEHEPITLVVPTSLQMGWCESPAFFCSASETARDIAQSLNNNKTPLPEHPLENLCMPRTATLPTIDDHNTEKLIQLLEVYVDDFIGLIHAPTHQQLQHFTRAILHAIHRIFPPANITKNHNDEPISLKKLAQGDGLWSSNKEILGWLFDGLTRTISLPEEKITSLTQELRNLSRRSKVQVRDLQRIQGRLTHAALGIPNGKGLLSPIVALVTRHRNHPRTNITIDRPTKQALQDWIHLLRMAHRQRTPCADLIPAKPDFLGYCDASKLGAGGVWFGENRNLPPIVWRIRFPHTIQAQLVSQKNPTGTITNSDLEMAGLLMHWLVLENVANLQHAHVASGCDNTPTVAWTSRLLASKATTAAHLIRALALRMLACQASPLAAFHIAGETNRMADFASRSHAPFPDDKAFLTHFATLFPTPQDVSWHLFLPNTNTSGKLFSALQTPTSPMASWLQTTNSRSIIGSTGSNFSRPISARTFKTYITKNRFPYFKPSSNGSDEVTSAEVNRSKPAPYKTPSAPSERPLSWPDSPTQPTNQAQQTTTSASTDRWKHSSEVTHQHGLN